MGLNNIWTGKRSRYCYTGLQVPVCCLREVKGGSDVCKMIMTQSLYLIPLWTSSERFSCLGLSLCLSLAASHLLFISSNPSSELMQFLLEVLLSLSVANLNQNYEHEIVTEAHHITYYFLRHLNIFWPCSSALFLSVLMRVTEQRVAVLELPLKFWKAALTKRPCS
jgi:hypothetical protein